MFKFRYHLSWAMVWLMPALLSAQPTVDFSEESFAQLTKEAQSSNKFIFVDFYADWCKPCKWMEKNVFTDSLVIRTLQSNYVSRRVDAETQEQALVRRHQIKAYPTLAIFAPNGRILVKQEGAMPAHQFGQMLQDVSKWSEHYELYQKNKEKFDNVVPYAHSLKWASTKKAERIIANLLKNTPEKKWSRPEYWELIKEFVPGTNLLLLAKVQRNHAIKAQYSIEYADYMRTALQQLLEKSISIKSKYNFNKYTDYLTQNQHIYENADSVLLFSRIQFANVSDASQLPVLLETYIEKYEKDKPKAYSVYAVHLVENNFQKDLLETAIKWAKYANSVNEDQLAYVTQGLAYEKLNRFKPAYANMLLAEEVAVHEEDRKQIAEHMLRIKAKMAIETGDGVTTARNPNQLDDGRFTLGAGSKRLMYGYPVPSSTSHFVVNVNGKLATNSPRLSQKGPKHINGTLQYSGTAMTPIVQIAFEFEGVKIVQKLTPVDKEFKLVTNGLAQFYKVSYDFYNQDEKLKNIGLGVLFDTMIDDNDFCAIAADGKLIETEVGLAYKDVPTELLFYRTKGDTTDMMGAAILAGNGATRPDKIVIGRWPILHEVTWKLSPQKVKYGDSAYFLKWENERLAPKGELNYVTYYGLPSFKEPELRILVEDESNLRLTQNVYFKHGSSSLDLNAKIQISELVTRQDILITGVLLNGYADITGGEDFNFDLSKKRIEEVGKVFDAYQLPYMPKPYGNDRSEYTALNESYGNVWDRRVEIVVYYKNKRTSQNILEANELQ